MKDKNGIKIDCENCRYCKYCDDKFYLIDELSDCFDVSNEAYEARIQELQKHNDMLQKRIEEFSMELLDRTMKENKDVLERLKEAESKR